MCQRTWPRHTARQLDTCRRQFPWRRHTHKAVLCKQRRFFLLLLLDTQHFLMKAVCHVHTLCLKFDAGSHSKTCFLHVNKESTFTINHDGLNITTTCCTHVISPTRTFTFTVCRISALNPPFDWLLWRKRVAVCFCCRWWASSQCFYRHSWIVSVTIVKTCTVVCQICIWINKRDCETNT